MCNSTLNGEGITDTQPMLLKTQNEANSIDIADLKSKNYSFQEFIEQNKGNDNMHLPGFLLSKWQTPQPPLPGKVPTASAWVWQAIVFPW